MLTRIEQLLRTDRFDEALAAIGSIDRQGLTTDELGYLWILQAETQLYRGVYDIGDLIDDAIETFRFGPHTDKFARAKFVKGWLLTATGNHSEAKQVLLEAHVNYLRCNDLIGSARALNRLAYVSLQCGNIDSSISSLRECISTYRRTQDADSVTVVTMNLAYLSWMSGRFAGAQQLYSGIASAIIELGEKNPLIYYEMSAIPFALKGDIKEARKRMAKCKPYLDTYKREKAIYLENLGLINILDGKYATAEKALTEGLELSLTIAPESALISQNKRLFGDLYIATEKYDLAEKYATEALVVAEKINERVEIAACWRVFAQVAQYRDKNKAAREWYDKAIDLFNLIGTRYELAVARYLAAASGLYNASERTAMLYMAREYFEAEEVAPFIAKVEAQLSQQPPLRAKVDKDSDGCPTIITVNEEMKKLLDLAEHVAQSEMTVFLTGETGTGKDLLARYIHFCSGRTGEFVTVNAAAIPNPMIEAELFGHTKGAFTSADKDRKGLIEQADKGTFYLNEIADATPEFQAKLLEVLETRQVRRLGSNKSTKVNFRLIAATNHDLKARMHDGHFRVDLYHRLNEIPLTLPRLSARTEDIPLLVEYFLADSGSKPNGDGDALERLSAALRLQNFPGNVRELQARVGHLAMVSRGNMDRMIELAQQSESERDRLLHALESCDWNRSRAARMLGVNEATIRRRIIKYDLAQPHSV